MQDQNWQQDNNHVTHTNITANCCKIKTGNKIIIMLHTLILLLIDARSKPTTK